jgi:hypothetical protein
MFKKDTDDLTDSYAFGNFCVKAARKMLAKFTLGVNFINILHASFFVRKCFEELFSGIGLAKKKHLQTKNVRIKC